MPVGYRPDRIEALDWQTRRAIANLVSLRSDDPAASGAMRSIFATIRDLEDHWLPLITAIRASEIMINWSRSRLDTLNRARQLTRGGLTSLSNDRLIAEIFALNQRWVATPRWYDDADVGFGDNAALAPLMQEVEARVVADPDFGGLLLDTAGEVDVLLLFLARGSFPTHLVARAARTVVGRPDHVGPDGLRRAVLTDALLGRVADDPGAALDMLRDVDVAGQILAFDEGLDIWADRPATPGVAALIHAGLVGAPSMTPDRRSEGFDVLGWFIERANDMPVDRDGFPPGVAAGLAIAMQHYVPMFIHSVDGSDSTGPLAQSGIHADRDGDGTDNALASYEEVTDFCGALLTDAGAVSLLGVLLAATADDVAYERTTLSEAAHLAGLLRDAARNEDLEAALAAAARTAQQGQIIGVLASATKVATGVGGTAKAVFDASTKFVTHLASATDGGSERADTTFDPGSLTRHLVQMASIRRLAADSSHRRDHGITSTPDGWSDVAMRLDELDRLAVNGADSDDMQTARQHIFNRVRELGGGAVIDSLDEHGTLASLPNRDVHGD